MTVARNFAEFLSYAPRTLLETNSQGASSLVWACRDDAELNRAPFRCPEPDHPMAFDEDAVLVLNRQTPLAMLVEAASSPALPPNLRQDLVLATWTRSVLLNDAASASKLAPHLPDSIRKTAGSSIGFPAILAILRNPGLRPFVEPGISHLVTFNYLDHFRNNWWCSSWYGQFTKDPWTAGRAGTRRHFSPRTNSRQRTPSINVFGNCRVPLRTLARKSSTTPNRILPIPIFQRRSPSRFAARITPVWSGAPIQPTARKTRL